MTTDTMTIDAAAVDAAIALNGKGSGNGYAPVTAKEWADLAAYPEDVAGVAGGLEAIAPAGAQGHAQEPAETLAELWARVGCHVLVRRRRAANLIPGESERPRFVVLDEPFKAPDGTKYRAGVWHFGSKPGRGDAPATLTQHLVCGPLHIDAVTFDGAGQNFGRLLRFKDTLGRWRNWAMPMEMLKGDGADLRGVLLAMGVYIDPSNAGRHWLAVYLQSQTPSRRMEAALQTGWAGQDFKAFALPDAVIGPRANAVTFQAQGLHADEYLTRGTLPGWQSAIAAPAVDNPVLVLALCAAFAGPLLALVGVESGGLHLVGDSSTGKTTALQAACSVWGGEGYRRSWRATANGLEASAALFNDSLLALDEISECDPRDVGEVVYMLGNGRGKARASRTGSARSVARWRSSVLSTGERSIVTSMQEAGQRVKAGQTVRLLDVPCERQHGAWDTLHGHASGPAFSDAIKRASRQHCGTAGRAFLEKLTRDTQGMVDRLEAIKAGLMAQANDTQAGGIQGGQPARAAARLAVLALAGELATAYGITGWPEGEATKAAGVGFAAWLAGRDGSPGNAEHGQVAHAVLGFVERHGDSRFSNADAPLCDELAQRVYNRAGWWRQQGEEREYLFTADGMREALKGFDFITALRALKAAGLLVHSGEGQHGQEDAHCGQAGAAVRGQAALLRTLMACKSHMFRPAWLALTLAVV
jgi:putative DNA primase/helicase